MLNAFAASVVPFGLVVTLILAQDDLGLPNNIARALAMLLGKPKSSLSLIHI